MEQKHYYTDGKNAQIVIASLAEEGDRMTTGKRRRMNTAAVV